MSKTDGPEKKNYRSPSRAARDEADKITCPVSPPFSNASCWFQLPSGEAHTDHTERRGGLVIRHTRILFDVSSVKTSHTLTDVIEDGGNFYQDRPTRTNPFKTGIHTEKSVESKSVPGSQTPRPPQCEECYSCQSARHL